jgi:DNA-binding transcriptional MerR regulator
LVKLYLRIGEVAELVGVQPHVLRYWETEFRGAIRPQKSKKGQRVYSRQDVERLLKVKDLLRNQGFTIAGARKVLREGVSARGETTPSMAAQATAAQAMQPEVVRSITPLRPAVAPTAPVALAPTVAVPNGVVPAAPPAVVWTAHEEITEQAAEPELQTLALSAPKSVATATDVAVADDVAVAGRAPMFELVLPSTATSDRSAKRLRRALVDLRQDVLSAIKELG